MAAQLVLASASPRRQELLSQLGVSFHVLPANIDETPIVGEPALAYVKRMAKDKALTGALLAAKTEANRDLPVLAADTSVVLDGAILGKPIDKADAIETLMRLSGHTHQVMTAISVHYRGRTLSDVVVTEVDFVRFKRQWAEQYWLTGEPADKAGSYGIQGIGGVVVEAIRGSYSSVVGLPLVETARILDEVGISVL